MGLKIDRQQIYKLVSEIDEDGSGEIEFNEFLAIMHKELYESDPHASVWKDDIYTEEDRKAAMKKKSGKAVADQKKKEEKALMPLNLLAGAYRRKKVPACLPGLALGAPGLQDLTCFASQVLDAVMENTGDMRKRLIASGHELRERNRQVEKASLHVEANTSTSWQQRAQTNRLVLDRVAESEALEIDILNPSLKRPAKEDEGASAKAEDEGIGEKPLGEDACKGCDALHERLWA